MLVDLGVDAREISVDSSDARALAEHAILPVLTDGERVLAYGRFSTKRLRGVTCRRVRGWRGRVLRSLLCGRDDARLPRCDWGRAPPRIDVDQVIEEVSRLMRAYGLASYDAVHAATALRTDPVAIVTTDVGFSALPAANTTIFTDASRVARCRELRARRR